MLKCKYWRRARRKLIQDVKGAISMVLCLTLTVAFAQFGRADGHTPERECKKLLHKNGPLGSR